MKLSAGLISILLTSAMALSVKRQNDAPDCVDGDPGSVSEQGPYTTAGDCLDVCYLKEQAPGENIGFLCKGYCNGFAVPPGIPEWICEGKPA